MLQKNRGDSGILEGVIFFVSLRFYFSLIFSIDYCQNSQYLQGFVGSGIRQKAIDTKLNTLPDLEMKKSNKIRTESFRENTIIFRGGRRLAFRPYTEKFFSLACMKGLIVENMGSVRIYSAQSQKIMRCRSSCSC